MKIPDPNLETRIDYRDSHWKHHFMIHTVREREYIIDYNNSYYSAIEINKTSWDSQFTPIHKERAHERSAKHGQATLEWMNHRWQVFGFTFKSMFWEKLKSNQAKRSDSAHLPFYKKAALFSTTHRRSSDGFQNPHCRRSLIPHQAALPSESFGVSSLWTLKCDPQISAFHQTIQVKRLTSL